jgi:hypothetical protein
MKILSIEKGRKSMYSDTDVKIDKNVGTAQQSKHIKRLERVSSLRSRRLAVRW